MDRNTQLRLRRFYANFSQRQQFGRQGAVDGLVLLGVLCTAAIVGWYLPGTLVVLLGWGGRPGWLMRISQLVGALGLAYVVVRGVLLCLVLFAIGVVVTILDLAPV